MEERPVLGEHMLKATARAHEVVVAIEVPHEGRMIGPYDFERPVIVPTLAMTLLIQHDDHQHAYHRSLLVLN